jgi:hypothetical protein
MGSEIKNMLLQGLDSASEEQLSSGVHIHSITNLDEYPNIGFIIAIDKTIKGPSCDETEYLSLIGFKRHQDALTWVKANVNTTMDDRPIKFRVLRVSQLVVDITLS